MNVQRKQFVTGSKAEDAYALAEQFATSIGRGNLVNITESSKNGAFYITVWYWGAPQSKGWEPDNSGGGSGGWESNNPPANDPPPQGKW